MAQAILSSIQYPQSHLVSRYQMPQSIALGSFPSMITRHWVPLEHNLVGAAKLMLFPLNVILDRGSYHQYQKAKTHLMSF